jgi:hypothetical protein
MQEEIVLQSGTEAFLVEGSLGGIVLEHIQGDAAQEGEMLRGVTDAHARGILPENDIERPIDQWSRMACNSWGASGQTRDIESQFGLGLGNRDAVRAGA